MVKYILGPKGSGKTRWLIENANEDLKSGNGNIAFVEVDDDHIFSLDYNVRLINATDYRLNDKESFYGFICGLLAMDYDLEKIYIDGIYKILNLNIEDLEFLKKKLDKIKDIESKEIFINIDTEVSEITDELKENIVELGKEK
ncbi:hypothetical protein [Peptoniphilus indolicus]|uniref:Uncharacterized protein n=2 Tax=Peptoniphilus indolicus TaxID=33030 RepID=G4D600_9FIRM|nr:hypothetical protein [Peptoniphilus indolicus]EGY77481.1 hypothetical protein HMPREF9129_1830 [Peptoniphilus indolicus ATCC 29427]SUB76211.1 Uncharacterised protein [Peptoniphilus indolicus]